MNKVKLSLYVMCAVMLGAVYGGCASSREETRDLLPVSSGVSEVYLPDEESVFSLGCSVSSSTVYLSGVVSYDGTGDSALLYKEAWRREDTVAVKSVECGWGRVVFRPSARRVDCDVERNRTDRRRRLTVTMRKLYWDRLRHKEDTCDMTVHLIQRAGLKKKDRR